jgi:hypothetical protein
MYDILPERIINKIIPEPNTGCWLWIGAEAGSNGAYGLTRDEDNNQRKIYAHVYVWKKFNGPVPDGCELDHKCRVRFCVNPNHLEPVTHKVNVHRGLAAPKSICIYGHVKEPGNGCKICNTNRAQQYRLAFRKANPLKPRTHCKNGHLLEGYNIMILKSGEKRCRSCHNETTNRNRTKPKTIKRERVRL